MTGYRLSDLYDADLRATDATARRLASELTIPHPLEGVTYADGTYPSRAVERALSDAVAAALGWQIGGRS